MTTSQRSLSKLGEGIVRRARTDRQAKVPNPRESNMCGLINGKIAVRPARHGVSNHRLELNLVDLVGNSQSPVA
jgi:hypothetical protein